MNGDGGAGDTGERGATSGAADELQARTSGVGGGRPETGKSRSDMTVKTGESEAQTRNDRAETGQTDAGRSPTRRDGPQAVTGLYRNHDHLLTVYADRTYTLERIDGTQPVESKGLDRTASGTARRSDTPTRGPDGPSRATDATRVPTWQIVTAQVELNKQGYERVNTPQQEAMQNRRDEGIVRKYVPEHAADVKNAENAATRSLPGRPATSRNSTRP